MNANFKLIKNLFSYLELEELVKEVNWQQNQIKVFGKTHLEPRLTQWFGPPYSYSSISWPAKEIPEFLAVLQRETEELCKFKFNAALLNYYRDGNDSMGWHSDDEKEIDQSCIASLSFGAVRKFKVRKKKDHGVKQDFILNHGSALIMKNAQELWQHSVPKSRKVVDPRLNITFRRILKPKCFF